MAEDNAKGSTFGICKSISTLTWFRFENFSTGTTFNPHKRVTLLVDYYITLHEEA